MTSAGKSFTFADRFMLDCASAGTVSCLDSENIQAYRSQVKRGVVGRRWDVYVLQLIAMTVGAALGGRNGAMGIVSLAGAVACSRRGARGSSLRSQIAATGVACCRNSLSAFPNCCIRRKSCDVSRMSFFTQLDQCGIR